MWPIKSGEGANQTSGMISAVKGGKGTIGYADLSQVGDLSAAKIKVGDQWVEPSAEGAANAVEASPLEEGRPENDMAVDDRPHHHGRGCLPADADLLPDRLPDLRRAPRRTLVKGFLTYVVSDEGQKEAADNSGSAPLPASFAEKAQKIVSSISASK